MLVGALAGATGQALDNGTNGQPWDQNLGRGAALGAALGAGPSLLFGAADAASALGDAADAGVSAGGGFGDSLSGAGDGLGASSDGLGGGDAGDAGDTVDVGAGGGCSFAAGTLVATPSGEQPIARLKVGDQVLAYNTATGQAEAEPIQHVWLNHDSDLMDVGLTEPSAPTAAGATTASRATSSAQAPATTLRRWLPQRLVRAAKSTEAATLVVEYGHDFGRCGGSGGWRQGMVAGGERG